MKLPDEGLVRQYLSLPWTIEAGTLDDGVRFARCREIPHAVAYADSHEDLDALFWDSLRASVESMLATGERIPRPLREKATLPPGKIIVLHSHRNDRLEISAAVGPAPTSGAAVPIFSA